MTPTTLSVAEPLAEVSNLTCRYGDSLAVDGVSFSARKGEILALLGPNGAGKSTTMGALCGVLTPAAGSVRIAGVDLLSDPVQAKRALGYLPEHPPLYPEMTVAEYLRFCARLRRVPRRRQREAVDQAIERCGLNAVTRRLLGNLSKGFQQRAGIAQAIVHRPPLIVLDEPTVGLDPNQIRQVRRLVRELTSESAVILSTHLLAEVLQVCDHVLIMNEGRVALRAPLSQFDSSAPVRALRVRFERPPLAASLGALPHVDEVAETAPGVFRLGCRDIGQAVQGLLEQTLSHGWGLRELVGDRRSLEEVFVELTLRDAGQGAGDEPTVARTDRAASPPLAESGSGGEAA